MEENKLDQLKQQHVREHAELSSTIVNLEMEITKRRERVKELNVIINTLDEVTKLDPLESKDKA